MRRTSLTVDEFINQLMRPAGKAGWTLYDLCGAKVNREMFVNTGLKSIQTECSVGTVDSSKGYVVLK